MSKAFNMEVFLSGVLTGSHATKQRHLQQAKAIQTAIAERWQRETPWVWQRKHVTWFLDQHLSRCSESTQYYYLLTIRILVRRLKRQWAFHR
ncbi:hypothetical protein ACF8QE_03245 [Pseudomonas sp. GLN_3]|uniref:hypothetical protein n=1 Tax=Pseudomonas sp. GLN_3 TaxID=3367181 RepID=UPI003709D2C8